MKDNFSSSLDRLLKHEGGYVNHPDDPGGRTNYGVTQRVYEDFLGREVTEKEMKEMPLEDVRAICVFDWAVNAGISRASKALQQAVNVDDDGIIGSQTVAMVCDQANHTNVVNTIAVKRENFYRDLKTFDTFGRGWLRRNDETRQSALKMAEKDV